MGLIAAGGIIIAAAALFIVLSGFAGLKTYSLQFMSYVDPDLKMIPKEGKSFMWSDADELKLTNLSEISNHSKIIEERVVISSENKNVLATIKGVDSSYQYVTQIVSMIRRGTWLEPETNELVSGWGISNQLSFGVLDFMQTLTLYVPKKGKGQIISARSAYNSVNVINVGLVDINEEMNNKYVYADKSLAQYLVGYKNNQYSAVELKLSENTDLDSAIEALNTSFGDDFEFKTRAQLNDALYKMLNTENLAVYLIFTLVIIIALFNVIGSIIMMILDKKKSLNTLYSMGLEIKDIKSIFFYQGSLMAILSGVIGLTLGVIIIALQYQFHLVMLTPELAYPVELTFGNMMVVLATICVLGILASKLASQRINKGLISL